MSTLLCTSKYRSLFGLPDDLSASTDGSNGTLGPWYANTLFIGSQRYLHYMSSRTLLPIIIWLRERQTAEERMRDAVRRLLSDIGIPSATLDAEMIALQALTYARASDRRHLGSLRDQTVVAKHMMRGGPALSPLELTMRLADMPSGVLNYRRPIESTAQVLGAVARPPLWRI